NSRYIPKTAAAPHPPPPASWTSSTDWPATNSSIAKANSCKPSHPNSPNFNNSYSTYSTYPPASTQNDPRRGGAKADPEVRKVSVKYLHRRALNDLVLQRRDPQRPQTTIRFRNVHPLRRFGPVASRLHPSMQV